jgi:hypothetical protein
MNAQEAEILLRRIEVKRLYLEPDKFFSLEKIQRISADFMTHSLETQDWRFLNGALKLNDWLRNGGNLSGDLSHQEKMALSMLRIKCGLADIES